MLAKLGSGGMGEVYRARDPRLGREVAIKVVIGESSADSDQLRRFQQEARTASALNHSNILTVYDVGEHEGQPYLVTELLEGRSLRDVLAQAESPIPPARALGWCAQAARGLAAAHDKGIVHRDLKPENLYLCRDGRVKILDFGLARLKAPLGGEDTTASAETMALATEAGTVLGTFGYMAPEQARGEPADERSDLFALGCVLYELLTATPAFRRSSPAETLSALLRDPPRTSLLPSAVPHEATRLLERLLAKDPAQRLRSAADVAIELDDLGREIAGSSSEKPSAPARPSSRHRSRQLLAVLVLAPFVALVLIVALTRGRGRPAAAPPGAAPLALVPLTADEAIEEYPTWSPDGSRIAFVRDSGGLRRVVLRAVAGGQEVEPTSGRFDELQPAFAGDGRALFVVRGRNPGQRLEPGDVFGSFRDADLWRVDLEGGGETKLIEGAYEPDVSSDGRRLVVEADWGGARRLWLLDAAGTNREQLTGGSSEAVYHLAPSWSPDGRWIAFQSFESTHTDISAVEVASRRTIAVTHDSVPDYYPDWEADGRSIVFSSPRGGGLNLWRVQIDVASGKVGRPEQLTQGAGQDVQAAVGPGDAGIAFAILRQNANLWRLPLEASSGRPAGEPAAVVTSSREDSRGAWAPDGRRIAFNSDRGGEMNLWIQDLASGDATQVTTGPGGDYQPSWSPDGKRLVFFSARSGSNDLWSVDLETRDLRRLTDAPGLEINPAVSPDGTAIAFQGDASGRFEVWLTDAEGRAARQLTHVGVAGHFLPWSRDSRSIFFRCPSCEGSGAVMRVAVQSGELQALPWIKGGSHLSLGAAERHLLDVIDHRSLWRSTLRPGNPEEIFRLGDPAARIDYPVLSPDGRAALFDRFQPQGGDIWRLSRPRS